MNSSVYKISLDIHKPEAQEVLEMKFLDTKRRIQISLTENGKVYQITPDCKAMFSAEKPDGNKIYNQCEIVDNTIVYDVTQQTLACLGEVDCEIQLLGSDEAVITSPRFSIIVHDRVYNGEDIVDSEIEKDVLPDLIAKSHEHDNKEVLDGITQELLDQIGTGGGLTPEQSAQLEANTEARHTHDNYWSLSDFYCEASEIQQGGNNPFPILPDVVGVDRPTFRENFLRYDSDGAVINKIEEKSENGLKFFRMWFDKGILNTLFDVPLFIDIPVTAIEEKTEIGLNGTGLELDLGVGSGGGNLSQFIEEVSGSVNLYPPTTEGWTNSATLQSSGAIATNTKDNSYVTPQILIEPNTTYTVNDVFAWSVNTGLADKNKGRTYTADNTALADIVFTLNADGSYTFTTPEGSAYIRFMGYKGGLATNSKAPIETIIERFNNQFMLVKGTSVPSVYEPYGKGGYRLKDIEIPLKSVKLENVNDKALPIFAPLAGKKIANFGDSIFGNARPPEDVSTYLADKTGAEVLNCAFGGCRMAIHNQLGHWNAFTMVNLATAIANGDYSVQDEALNYDDRTSYAEQPLSVIKTTDFSTVDILTIAYGTNDFTSNIPLDNADNPYDTTTLAGALRTAIESLLTAYPNLKIFVLSTMYRFYIDDNNEFTEDSNTRVNSIGLKLGDYNAKLKEVAGEYNLPYVDDYNIGIGKFNRYQYFNANDGAHHNKEGRRLIAEHLASALCCANAVDYDSSCSNDIQIKTTDAKFGSFIHISFDDVTLCIENLINKTYTSVFEEPFFAWLKSLNKLYGAKFSLYVINIANLANVPDTYKNEFLAAKDWLKFGLHSNTANSTYENETYATGAADWNAFVGQIIRITGTFETIDRVPRLHYFYGSKEALQGMRDCECGALGFLAADDSRQSYYLTASQNSFLKTHDSIIDFANGLLFYNTDFRGDWFKSGFTSENIYDVPVKSNVYDELLYRFALAKYADTFKSYIYFCHEWQFYNGTVVNENRAWTEDICRFGNDYNIPFDYPQNRIDINPTSFTFLSVNSGGITDSGEYLFSTFETFVLDNNNTRLRANQINKNFTFKANDVISIGDYNTYALAVGSGNKEDNGDYDDAWFDGGYVTSDFVLTAEQAASVKQIIIKRNDGAVLTETDLNYIKATAKVIRQ